MIGLPAAITSNIFDGINVANNGKFFNITMQASAA